MSIRNTLIALPFVVFAAPAFAQDAAIDTDGDSAYSFAELQAAMPDLAQEDFDAMDANADGVLDADEIAAATEAEMLMAN